MNIRKFFPFLFLTFALLELCVIYMQLPIRFISKPLILIGLIGYYLLHKKAFNIWFFIALLFALGGDIFLLNEGSQYFLAGLGSFLIMQLLYAFAFFQQTSLWLKKNSIFTLVAIGYCFFLVYYLWPSVPGMQIPVAIYAGSISLMAIMANWRHQAFKGWNMLMFGVLLFIFSDSILAIHKFATPVIFGDLILMGSYMAAQYCIVKGYIASKV